MPFNAEPEDQPDVLLFNLCFITLFVITMLYLLMRRAERVNTIPYDDRTARIISGFIKMIMQTVHTDTETIPLPRKGPVLFALVPHLTGWDAFTLGAKLNVSKPPRFMATNSFDSIPGVAWLLDKLKVIKINFDQKGKVLNGAEALDTASQALEDDGFVGLFPQGNFSYTNEPAPFVQTGTARLAIKHKIPIHVVRLDGYWSIQNPLVRPIRDNRMYRAFGSIAHPNKIKTNLCWEIDVHLQAENEALSEDELIRLISAEIFAFCDVQEMTEKKIEFAKKSIKEGSHLTLWDKRVALRDAEKALKTAKADYLTLEKASKVKVIKTKKPRDEKASHTHSLLRRAISMS